ncbi:MAG: AMP-binding protein, partial [Cytophagales bacterium]|nr:AMP-binding protein [Cytophagales bacterium]
MLVITGIIDRECLRQSVERVVGRHEALRTGFAWEDGELFQVVTPDGAFGFDQQARYESGGPAWESIVAATEYVQAPFRPEGKSLFGGALIKISADKTCLVFKAHPLIADQHSLKVLIHEVLSEYRRLTGESDALLPAVPLHYTDYSSWQGDLLDSLGDEACSYWKNKLNGGNAPLELPGEAGQAAPAFKLGNNHFTIPPVLVQQLRALSEGEGISTPVVTLAALNILLGRYSGADEVTIGLRADNRSREQLAGMIGPVADTFPLRSEIRPGISAADYFACLTDLLEEVAEVREVPSAHVRKHLPAEQEQVFAQLNVVYAYDGAGRELPPVEGWETEIIDLQTPLGRYGWGFYLREEGPSITGTIVYNAASFSDEAVDGFAGHYLNLLEAMLEQPDGPVAELSLLSPEDIGQLLQYAEQHYPGGSDGKSVPAMFEEQVERTPEATALSCQGEAFTYRWLNDVSNQLAHHLRAAYAVKPNQVVAILLDRSEWAII